jgi:glycosyltransferase involved in cell wall biosynthesis
MPKITFSIIVKNEEKNLPQCLDSVRELVDEIVVLDTGSTDKTVAIAKKYGAEVYYFEWCNDFAIARNEALKYLTGDWVLVLDADEVLNPAIIPAIRTAIDNPKRILVNLIRQEIGATQSPYSSVSRLFRRHPALKFARPYHAIIDDSLQQLLQQETDWQIVDLAEVAVFHYGYQAESIASQDKYNRARMIMEGFYHQNPNDPYVCSKLGALYVKIGETAKGTELLKKGLRGTKIEPSVLFELHYHLGNTYARSNKPNLAAKQYQEAIRQPIMPLLKIGAYNNFGSLLQAAGQLQLAQQAYETVLKIDPNLAITHYNLGMNYKAMGKLDKSIECYRQALKIDPDYASARQNLGVALLKNKQVVEGLAEFQQAITLHEQNNNDREAKKLREGLQEIGFYL